MASEDREQALLAWESGWLGTTSTMEASLILGSNSPAVWRWASAACAEGTEPDQQAQAGRAPAVIPPAIMQPWPLPARSWTPAPTQLQDNRWSTPTPTARS